MADPLEHASRAPLRWSMRFLLAWVLAGIGLGMFASAGVFGLIGWADDQRLPSVGVVPRADPARSAAPVLSASRDDLATAIPARLRLPSLGIDAPVRPVTVLPGGGLEVPEDARVLGWWRDGAHPDSSVGTVVIVGHVDSVRDGAGALFYLSEALPGQQIILDTDRGSRRYVITALRSYPKTDLPAQVFATTGLARLVVITCGGAFDAHTRQYADNVVAYAVPD
ncbi:MAG: class F sortase [Pseudonocardia sp.]|nr:class F sortase [Pseudonocardia sp.]